MKLKLIALFLLLVCLTPLVATVVPRIANDDLTTWYTGSNLNFTDSYALSQVVVSGSCNAVATAAVSHTLVVGDQIVIVGATGDTDLNNATPLKISAVTSNTFTWTCSNVTNATYNNSGIYAIPIGKFKWDLEHDPGVTDNVSSSAVASRWDFEGGTCNTTTERFSFTGLMLPDGTEVKLGGTTLPTDVATGQQLAEFWPSPNNRRQSYYIRDSTSATTTRTTSGTFKLAYTYGGPAIDLGGSCSAVKLTFAGYRQLLTMLASGGVPIKCDPATDKCWRYDPLGDPNTPIVNSYTSSSSFSVVARNGSTIPGGLTNWYGSSPNTYCVVPSTGNMFYLRFSGGACVTAAQYQTAPFAGQWTCFGRNISDGNKDAACQATDGVAFVKFTGFKFTSVVSGTKPADVSLNTWYWSLTPATYQAFSTFQFSTHRYESRHAFGNTETVVYNVEVPIEDITDAGTGTYYASTGLTALYVEDISKDTGTKNGFPAGTTYTFRSGQDLCCRPIGVTTSTNPNRWFAFDVSNGRGTFGAKIPAHSAPGSYTVTVNLDQNSNGTVGCADCVNVTIPVVVNTLVQVPRRSPTLADYTAVPNKSGWLANQTSTASGGVSGSYNGRSNFIGCAPPNDTYAEYAANKDINTALSGALTTGTTVFNVSSSTGIVTGQIIKIDNENMLVTNVSGNQLTVTRAYPNPITGATTAASHSSGARVGGPYGASQNHGSLTSYDEDWYYDGGNTYSELYKITGLIRFKNCADYEANFMATFYGGNPSSGQSFAIWSRNMRKAYGRWKGMKFPGTIPSTEYLKYALKRLAEGQQDLYGNNNAFTMRETSHAMDTKLNIYDLERGSSPDLPIFADAIIGFVYTLATGAEVANFHEPFMGGLMFRALAEYYHIYHKDPRIPYVLKLLVDKTYNDWYNHGTHVMLYNPFPYGRKCYNICGQPTPLAGEILNGMMVGPAWWLFGYMGDTTYRDIGDEWFQWMYASADPTNRYGSAKMANQAHYNVTDMIKVRENTDSPY